MHKKAAFGVGLLLLAAPLFAAAQSVDVQAQIQSLLAQIQQLQALLAQVQQVQGGNGGGDSTSPPMPTSCVNLSHSIGPDDTDANTGGDVSRLQQFLTSTGDYTGSISGHVGPATVKAIESWQSSHGLVSSGDPDSTGFGYVGPATRAKMACNTRPFTPPQVNNSTLSASPNSDGSLTVMFSATVPVSQMQDRHGIAFGDGQTGEMTSQCGVQQGGCQTFTATHTYATAGAYTANLIENYCTGACSIGTANVTVATTYVTVTGSSSNSSFTATPASGSAPLAVVFQMQHAEGTYVDFGDGSDPSLCTDKAAGNCSAGISHTYNNAGQYTARLLSSRSICAGASDAPSWLLSGCTYAPGTSVLDTQLISVTGTSSQSASIVFSLPAGTSVAQGQSFPINWNVTNVPGKGNYQVELVVERFDPTNPGSALEQWHWQSPMLSEGNSSGTHQSNVWDGSSYNYPGSTRDFPAGSYRIYAFATACNPLGCSVPRTSNGSISQQLATNGPVTFIVTTATSGNPSIVLTSPPNGTSYTVGDSIPVAWQVTGAPPNSQVLVSFKQTAFTGGNVGTGTWQSPVLQTGTSVGSHVFPTGPSVWDSTGTFQLTAKLRQCDPRGCQWNSDFPGLQSNVTTYASTESNPTTITITANSGPTCFMYADKPSYGLGDAITLRWFGANATYASFAQDTSGKDTLTLPGDKFAISSSVVIPATVSGNPSVTLNVYNSSGQKGSCSATMAVSGSSNGGLMVSGGIQPVNTLAPQGTFVDLTKFTVTNTGSQDATITGLSVRNTFGAYDGAVTELAIKDQSGAIVSGPVSIDHNTHQAIFSDTISIPKGQTITYTIYGKIGANNSAYSGGLLQFSIIGFQSTATMSGTIGGSAGTITGATDTINTSLNACFPPNPIYGYKCWSGGTTATGSFNVSMSSTPAAQTIVGGSAGVTVANVVLDASGSSEDIRLPALFAAYNDSAPVDPLQCQAFDGGTVLTTGSHIVNPTGSGFKQFQFDNVLTLSRGTVKTISIKCNIPATATNGSFNWSEFSGGPWSGTGVTSGMSVGATVTTSTSGTMTIGSVANGSVALTVSTDASSPALQNVTAGTTGVVLGAVKFRATGENIQLNRVKLQLGDEGASPSDLLQVYLYDGATLLGSTIFANSFSATSILTQNLTLFRDTDKVLTIRGDISSNARSGDMVQVQVVGNGGGTTGNGLSSGSIITASGISNVAGVRIGGTSSTGTYIGYMDGNMFITTQNVSQTDALSNCKLNASNNLNRSVRCTWSGVEIYNTSAQSSCVTPHITQPSAGYSLALSQNQNGVGQIFTSDQPLTYTLTNSPSWASFSGNQLTFNAVPANGTYTFGIIGTNSCGRTATFTLPVTVVDGTASIDQASLTSSSGNPTITGSASGQSALGLAISNSGGKVYGSGIIGNSGGRWSHAVTTNLPNGTYAVNVYNYYSNANLTSGTLTIGSVAVKSFGATNTLGTAPLTVSFTSSGADGYTLDFGDGQTMQCVSGSCASVTHVYSTVKTYYANMYSGTSFIGGTKTINVATQTQAAAGAPAAPTNLVATCLDATHVSLTWGNSSGATGYAVRLNDTTNDGANCADGTAPVDSWLCANSGDSYSDSAASGYHGTVVAGHSYAWWVQSYIGATWSDAARGTFTCTGSLGSAPSQNNLSSLANSLNALLAALKALGAH